MTAGSRHTPSLIAKKRDGGELDASEVRWLIAAFARGEVADYQMSAFAMAALLRGMTPAETLAMTLAIRDSGRAIEVHAAGPKVDKHSTGGVGDKVSICLAPAAAACGLYVPMICGRGLGHTGGTVDKLEAIPGFQTRLEMGEFERVVEQVGCALIGQTDDLAPADRKLYALRDVTATVESVPLITASILGKKLCADLDALVLDVKVGRGAFMPSLGEARQLARSLVDVGAAAGLRVTAVLTAMDQPLGSAVGNALETAEAFEVLCGAGPSDVLECTVVLGREMLLAGGLERDAGAAERRILYAIRSGAAAAKLETMIAAQHGDPRVVREPDRLPKAPVVQAVHARATGFVRELDARMVAQAALALGSGRARMGGPVDPAVGVVLRKKTGDAVEQGEVLAELHGRKADELDAAARALTSAYAIGDIAPAMAPLVIEAQRASR
jgi:pyrimidine-nucleoside phosphorylase